MNCTGRSTAGVLAGLLLFLANPFAAEVIDLGGRRELFLDDYLLSEMKNVQILVHQPEPREIAVRCDAPWEGNGCGYYTVLHDARESVYRMYYHAWHVVETRSTRDDAPKELSLYATESYFTGRDSRLRRYALRIDGFASVHAKRQEGEFTTQPLRFSGNELSLNVATSAAGMVKVEIREPGGTPMPGFTLEECDLVYGDALDRRVSWKGNRSIAALRGKPVVLRFVMREADIYSLAFE